MPQDRPPLGLHAEVTLADGTQYRWDSASKAGDIPQGISFRTKKGDGFADASVTLSRRIDRDYIDLNLYDDFALVGYDGSIAYEGRVAANPRSLGEQSHQVSVVLQGWMSHAKDRKFTEIYVDRNTSSWGEASLGRRAALSVGGIATGDLSWSVGSGLVCSLPTTTLATQTAAELWYTAPPGVTIGAFSYIGADTSLPASWEDPALHISSDDVATTTESYSLTLDSALRYLTVTTPRRYARLREYSNGTSSTPAAGASRSFAAVAVYGNHGVTNRTIDSSTPDGLYASDVITNIVQRFCPRLSPAGVQTTTYPIPHLVFTAPTAPFDAFLDVNKYHLWNLAVYENKTLYFQPFDYTDYDWEVRLSDPGVTFDPQGDSTDQFANGICVNYTDVDTGKPARITPDDNPALLDTSVTNPANAHGLDVWMEITLSSETTTTAATQIGVASLAEFNQPKAPGTIKVTGHIRDRAGHWQQVWKVRAGDRIVITDHPNDSVRLVAETDYSHDNKTLSMAIDQSFMRLDAVLDRVSTALAAANLS